MASPSPPTAGDGASADGEAPRAGKCGACTGCSGSAAVLASAPVVPVVEPGVDRPAYLPQAPSLGLGNNLFRPPRTLTA